MPQRLPVLKRQRGSILAGVLGLSVLLSVSAAGYILVSGQVGGEDAESYRRARLYLGAESGLLMGARYVMRTWHPNTMYASNFASIHAVSGAWRNVDGIRDSVVLYKNPSTEVLSIVCWATDTVASDTLRLTWTIDAAVAPVPPIDGVFSKLTMKNWQDTILIKR